MMTTLLTPQSESLPLYITRYWGKARPARDDGADWHPLAYHSLDVAAAMLALLGARPKWLASLAETTGLPAEELRKRLVLIAAFHDLGKFAECFQVKAPEIARRLGHESGAVDPGHGCVGWGYWNKRSKIFDLRVLDGWMYAACSHHGAPVVDCKTISNAMSEDAQTAAADFVRETVRLIGQPSADKPEKSKHEIWRLAGLVILADWIGSNQNGFPYTPPTLSLCDYWSFAQERGHKALRETALLEAPAATELDLKILLGQNTTPSPLQAWAERQAPENTPQLYMIEDLTGAGKTEAALILAHRLMRAGAAEGLYWALPSMATANGLYGRLRHLYQKLFAPGAIHPSLVLAHSAADLNDPFQASIQTGVLGSYGGNREQDVSAETACAAFFAEDRKKTFLAQVGVGTLDQALLGALPVRHQALRLLALSRRVLVIDEAHAYDEYMTKGLEALLRLQKASGGSAIILSATLTQDQRRRFAAAYGGEVDAISCSAFPLTTHISAHGQIQEQPQTSLRGTRRDLPYVRFDQPTDAMDALLDKARAGFCGVYIRNSVKEALETYAYLKSQHDKTDIFHARFCLSDRIARETAILARFGKDSRPEQRQGQILVATQVVEQSLDLDFDYMVTDLCPMDLLIQRAGRLHRHERAPARPDPALWVVSAPPSQTASADWFGALFKSGQYVYPHIGQLWRTAKVLETVGGVHLLSGSPRDLIEPVFVKDAFSDLPDALRGPSQKVEAQQSSEKAVANLNFLKLKDFSPDKDAWGSDIHTPTRLGEPTTTLRLARWANGALTPWAGDGDKAWRLSEISIRSALCKTPLAPSDEAARAIEAVYQDWNLRFDPPPILPLTLAQEDDVWVGAWKDSGGMAVTVTYSSQNGLSYA